MLFRSRQNKEIVLPKTIGYYSVLGLDREPFSTSPDPEFFYHTREHDAALTNLLIELRLRRGLSVILGDVGTGKTTLCRKLLHELNSRGDTIFHLILNPSFESESQFLSSLLSNFGIQLPRGFDSNSVNIMHLRDVIERFLLEKTLKENRTIILLIDEAQKLDLGTLETLRILLNFETNAHKLVQLILMGQLEMYFKIVQMHNFLDRISFKFTLNPLDVKETEALIRFRLEKAGYHRDELLFYDDAVSVIYNETRGYPRKIVMLCHKIIKEMIMQNQTRVNGEFVRAVATKESQWLSASVQLPVESSQII